MATPRGPRDAPGRVPLPSSRRRRLLTSVLAAGVAPALLAACGPAPAETGAPVPAAREKTLIFDTDWLSGQRGEVTDRALQEWAQRYPTVRIDKRDVLTQAGTVFEKTATLIASDSLGDVMLWAGYIFVYYAKRGLYVDVGPYLKKHRISLDERYVVPEHIIYDGKTYGFPFQFIAVDWLYNKSLFASKGVRPPDDGWTWDDLVDVGRRLTAADGTAFGLAPPGYWRELLWAAGGEERSKDDKKTLLDTPAAVEAVTYAAELATRHKVAPTAKDASAQRLSATQGNYALWMGVASRGLDQSIAGRFEWDLLYAPKWPKTGKRFVSQNEQPLVITSAAQKHDVVEEAALFGAFMSGEFVQGLVARYGNTTPVYKKAADSDDFLPASKWKRKVIIDGFNYRRYHQGTEWWWAWSRVVEAELAKALNGEVSPRDAALAATRAGDAAIAAQSLQPPPE
jgi:ABC-type glycerol-3-phosphate transport system substrate-binding protein